MGNDLLNGEEVIPGFTFTVAELFAEYDFETEPLEAEEVLEEEKEGQDWDSLWLKNKSPRRF